MCFVVIISHSLFLVKETDHTSKKQATVKPKKVTGGRSAKLQAILQRVQKRRKQNEEKGVVEY
jgi:hypothetical protein